MSSSTDCINLIRATQFLIRKCVIITLDIHVFIFRLVWEWVIDTIPSFKICRLCWVPIFTLSVNDMYVVLLLIWIQLIA